MTKPLYDPDYKKMYESVQNSRRFQAAVAAMQALIPIHETYSNKHTSAAVDAVIFADALLAELDKKEADR